MTGCSSVEWRTVTDILKFEDKFREKLADILKEVKKRYRFVLASAVACCTEKSGSTTPATPLLTPFMADVSSWMGIFYAVAWMGVKSLPFLISKDVVTPSNLLILI